MKKIILIVDQYNKRDNLQWDIYRKLQSNANFDICITEDINGEIKNVMYGNNIGRVDLILMGLYYGKFIKNSMLYIQQSEIPCIIDCADNEELYYNEYASSYIKSGIIKAIITKYYPSQKLNIFLKNLNFSISKLFNIEWGIHPVENIKPKDIDVSFIASIDEKWIYHEQRKYIKRILSQNTKYKIFCNNIWGDDYKNVLSRSKIFVVEGSMRKSITQKYLEAGISGCLLVGDRPIIPQITACKFTNNIMTEVTDWDTLNDVINVSLSNPQLMQYKVNNCINMIKEDFDISEKVARYEDLFTRAITKKI